MVLYFPVLQGRRYRLWLLTRAPSPEVAINQAQFRPRTHGGGEPAWFDFGVIEGLYEVMGQRGFGQIKFFGVNEHLAADSYCVLTAQTDKELGGSVESVEELLWGITRAEVGRAVVTPADVPVGQPTEFTLRYRAGRRGLPPGTLLRVSVPGAFARPQVESEGKPGYLHVVRSDAPLRLESIDKSPESHEKIDVIFSLPEGLKAGGLAEASYYTDFTYLFEGCLDAMERRYWYSHLPPLGMAVAVDERMQFVPPLDDVGNSVRFKQGPAERVHLFLPGRRRNNEPIRLVGVLTDKYRNISPMGSPRIPLDFWLRLEGGGEIVDLGTPYEHFVADYRFEMDLGMLRPGVYRVEALDARKGTLIAVSNPLEILGPESGKRRVYWGEIHGHSAMSDGFGDLREMLRHARDEAALDFAASGDHACYFSDNQWRWMQDVINSFNKNQVFVALIGYEWAGEEGHRNVYTSENSLDLFRGMYPPTSRVAVVWKRFEQNPEVVAGPHTAHVGRFWEGHSPAVVRFLEIYSMWGPFDEKANQLLNEGARLGFTGGGDCHEGHCFLSAEAPDGQGKTPHGFAACIRYKSGITGVALETLDRRGLVRALRDGQTWATTGARILLDFSVAGVAMGDEGDAPGDVTVRAEVHACNHVDRIEVVRDGDVVHCRRDSKLDQTLEWTDVTAPSGRHWYYVRIVQEDQETAWSSPVWVTVK